MSRSSIFGLVMVPLFGCGGSEPKRISTEPTKPLVPPVAGVPAPDWGGPAVKLMVEPALAKLPGSAEVTFELPSASWRLQQQQSRIEDQRFALRYRLTSPADGETEAEGEISSRTERVPVPAGSVRVEVWVDLRQEGDDADEFDNYVLAMTALRQVGR